MKSISTKNKQNIFVVFIVVLIFVLTIIGGVFLFQNIDKNNPSYNLDIIPEYSGKNYITLYGNIPDFNETDYQTTSFENYSNLDDLGRVGVAFANIGQDLMPTEERESISNIYPTGFKQEKYDIISGKYLYNRCHLIGHQLTGENANKNNLMTCTRNMNAAGMLPYENKVAEYIKETNKHVLYRVTPIFENDNLLANGVQIEASSVEDRCKTICFNIYVYNNQDGIKINYLNGESKLLKN